MTRKPSPSWPFLLIDSRFEGQRIAGIDTEEAGLTLVRDQFKNMPSAVIVHEGRAEELWIKDSYFENLTAPAIVISEEFNARSQTNLQNVICNQVPVLLAFRQSGRKIPGEGSLYAVNEFCHGLQISGPGAEPELKTTSQIQPLDALPKPVPSDIPALPDSATWVNLAALGAKGDGIADDTEVLKEAVAKYRTIYLPAGSYRVTDTITLHPGTALIGLNPITTQILLSDSTQGFEGEAPPKPLMVTPKGGSNIVSGIGLDTGNNCGAIAMKWMAGKNSLMNDVRFLGGHGTFKTDGTRVPVYNNNRTGDADPARRWDSQYYSLWITDGGGGTFKDIWTPNSFAQAGIYLSETKTEGRMYAISVEHHVRNEVKLKNVSNWQFFAMQTEEERGEGPRALPVSIENCSNLLFANLYLYRVGSDFPFPCGVKITASQDIVFRGVHAYSPGKTTFDSTILDATNNREVRSREIAWLTVPGKSADSPSIAASAVLEDGAKVQKCAGGFDFIDGAAVDANGNVYFVDGPVHRIYRWSPGKKVLALVRDNPIDPLLLAFDRAGNLLVVSRTGVVYAFDPNGHE
ncbi:MAG: glycosyl hydrolase family 28-related protein, partial [Verrucomicrobiota bacterium]